MVLSIRQKQRGILSHQTCLQMFESCFLLRTSKDEDSTVVENMSFLACLGQWQFGLEGPTRPYPVLSQSPEVLQDRDFEKLLASLTSCLQAYLPRAAPPDAQ